MIEILDYQETPLGVLCLRRRELLSRPGTIVTEVTLDHVFLMSSYHTESERALADRALALHRGAGGLRVVVGGLGLGFTARAALADERVTEVEVVELLPEVIAWLDEEWIPESASLRDDARFKVTRDDVYSRLLAPPADGGRADAILIDVDHAPDEMLTAANAPFYTPQGLRRLREHLRPGGVVGIWSTYPSDEFAALLADVFDEVTVEVVSWWNDLVDTQKEDTLFFARRRDADG